MSSALKQLSVCVLVAAGTASCPAADTKPANALGACSAAEYRQLDYWIGDWDTFEADAPDGSSIARARVSRIAEACAVHELYVQNDGLIGDSILSYDPVRKEWQQTWVTNRGSLMVIHGSVKDGTLIMQGEVHLKDGSSVMQRISWMAEEQGVREWAVLSRDGGKTWSPAFDVHFRRHPNE